MESRLLVKGTTGEMTKLFLDSLIQHQRLLDAISDFADEDGICRLSQTELGKIVGRSQIWVSQAIKRINSEDICIKCVSGGYKAIYPQLAEHGVFSTLLFLCKEVAADRVVFFLKDAELAQKYNVPLKTVQMLKSYFRTGHRVASREMERNTNLLN